VEAMDPRNSDAIEFFTFIFFSFSGFGATVQQYESAALLK
jgi:hypothetical protein